MTSEDRAVRRAVESTRAGPGERIPAQGPRRASRSQRARVLMTLVIPQGYTLSIAGSFAVAVGRYGVPSPFAAYAFVVGAAAAFVVLVLFTSTTIRAGSIAAPAAVVAMCNGLPVAVVPIAGAVIRIVPNALVGFLVAGASAVTAYVLLLSLFWSAIAARLG